MTRADFVGGLLLSAIFGAALWEGWSFQYGTEFAPGPGFAPVWLSAIGLCVSLMIAAHGLWAMRSGEDSDQRAAPALETGGLVRVALLPPPPTSIQSGRAKQRASADKRLPPAARRACAEGPDTLRFHLPPDNATWTCSTTCPNSSAQHARHAVRCSPQADPMSEPPPTV